MIVAFALLTGREMLQQKRSRIAKNLARASGLPLLVRLIAFFFFLLVRLGEDFFGVFLVFTQSKGGNSGGLSAI